MSPRRPSIGHSNASLALRRRASEALRERRRRLNKLLIGRASIPSMFSNMTTAPAGFVRPESLALYAITPETPQCLRNSGSERVVAQCSRPIWSYKVQLDVKWPIVTYRPADPHIDPRYWFSQQSRHKGGCVPEYQD